MCPKTLSNASSPGTSDTSSERDTRWMGPSATWPHDSKLPFHCDDRAGPSTSLRPIRYADIGIAAVMPTTWLCRVCGGRLGWSRLVGTFWGEGHGGPGRGQRGFAEFAATSGVELVELEGVPVVGVLFTVEDGGDVAADGCAFSECADLKVAVAGVCGTPGEDLRAGGDQCPGEEFRGVVYGGGDVSDDVKFAADP